MLRAKLWNPPKPTFAQTEIKLQSLQEQIALEWGQNISKLSANRFTNVDQQSDHRRTKAALARVDLPRRQKTISTVNQRQLASAR